MSTYTRAIIDTNVAISWAISPTARAAQAARLCSSSAVILISASTLNELEITLRHTKFSKYILSEAREQFILDYVQAAEPVFVTHTMRACRDPRDDKFLELALSGQADLLLTGDADLLSLHPWRSVDILSPAQYLAL